MEFWVDIFEITALDVFACDGHVDKNEDTNIYEVATMNGAELIYNQRLSDDVRELSSLEIDDVSGGVAPLVIPLLRGLPIIIPLITPFFTGSGGIFTGGGGGGNNGDIEVSGDNNTIIIIQNNEIKQ